MQDQIEIIDKAKAAGKEPDYVPAVSALGGGIGGASFYPICRDLAGCAARNRCTDRLVDRAALFSFTAANDLRLPSPKL
ncbi:MAG: hypothetical protein EBW54_10810 [Betaproteobacteria bacterium]|nr:hypothetical protein [Betaproteobacteria bacterium]